MKKSFKFFLAFLVLTSYVPVVGAAPFYNYICDRGVCALVPQAYFQPFPGNLPPQLNRNGFRQAPFINDFGGLGTGNGYNGVNAQTPSAGYNGIGTGGAGIYRPY